MRGKPASGGALSTSPGAYFVHWGMGMYDTINASDAGHDVGQAGELKEGRGGEGREVDGKSSSQSRQSSHGTRGDVVPA